MSLPAEALAAVTGLWPGPSSPTENDRLAAYGLLDRWRGRLARWMRQADEPEPFDWQEPPEAKALQKKIVAPIDEPETTRIIAHVGDHDLGREYIAILEAGRNYLDAHWRKVPVPGLGSEVFDLSVEDLATVWNLTRVLDGPDTLLDEISSYSVTVDMIDAFHTVYPELASAVGDMLDDLLIDHMSRKKALTCQQEDIFRMVRGIPRNEPVKVEEQKPKDAQQPQPGKPTKAISLRNPASQPQANATPADFKP
jgi:hypothetical protein